MKAIFILPLVALVACSSEAPLPASTSDASVGILPQTEDGGGSWYDTNWYDTDIETCNVTPIGACGTTSITFALTAPCGQESVQLFVKKNGQQILSTSVYAYTNLGSSCRYTYTVSGFVAGDFVAQRWWTFDAPSTAVYWPGPGGTNWVTFEN